MKSFFQTLASAFLNPYEEDKLVILIVMMEVMMTMMVTMVMVVVMMVVTMVMVVVMMVMIRTLTTNRSPSWRWLGTRLTYLTRELCPG